MNELFGLPLEMEHNGKKYKCSLITQEVKNNYEKGLHQKAKESAKALRDLMTAEEYRLHLIQLNNDYIAGEYSFESKLGLATIKTLRGFVMLASLLFSISEEEVLNLLITAKEEVAQLIHMAFQQSFPGVVIPKDTADDEKKG